MRMTKKVEFEAGDVDFLKPDDDKENVFIKTAEMGDSCDHEHHKLIQGNEYNLILTRVISGPRLDLTLLELQGRIYNRKGVIPKAIIQNFDEMDFVPQNDDRSFLKDVYFRLSIIDRLLENTKYLARFYVRKTDEEQQTVVHGEQGKEVEYVRQPNSDRLPPIRSQARGIVSRDQMDIIDGIQFVKPVCPSVSVWRSQNHVDCNQQDVRPPLTVNNALQADCLDAVTTIMFDAALRSGLQPPCVKGETSDRSLPVKAQQSGEQTATDKGDVMTTYTTGQKNAKRSLRKSIKKRLGSFFAAIFGCARRQDKRDD